MGGCDTGADCVAKCQAFDAPDARCGVEHDAYATCKTIDGPCGGSSFTCNMQESAYGRCLHPGILGCAVNCVDQLNGSCGCTVTCDGVEMKSDCVASGPIRNCTCSRAGATVGQCVEPATPGSSCGFDATCCGELLAAP